MTNLIHYHDTLSKEQQEKLNAEYKEWVSYLPCCISGSVNVGKPHHLRYAGYCGVGMKPADIWQIPITYENHILIHTKGRKFVEKKFEINFIDILTTLHERFMKEMKL